MNPPANSPPDRRTQARPVSFNRRATVEMETSASGCFIAHVEDDTGEHVVLSVDDAHDAPQPKVSR